MRIKNGQIKGPEHFSYIPNIRNQGIGDAQVERKRLYGYECSRILFCSDDAEGEDVFIYDDDMVVSDDDDGDLAGDDSSGSDDSDEKEEDISRHVQPMERRTTWLLMPHSGRQLHIRSVVMNNSNR